MTISLPRLRVSFKMLRYLNMGEQKLCLIKCFIKAMYTEKIAAKHGRLWKNEVQHNKPVLHVLDKATTITIDPSTALLTAWSS